MKTIAHWMNNDTYPGASGDTATVTNPATGDVTGEVALGSIEDARAVIDAAAAAFPTWRDTSLANAPRSSSTSVNCSTPARVSWLRSSPASTARSCPTPSARSAAARR